MPPRADTLVEQRLLESARLKESLANDAAFRSVVAGVAAAIVKALRAGNRIFFFGNGGSAADAQHLAAELTGRYLRERPALAGIALTANSSSVTAIGNDYGMQDVFARQLEGLGREGDVAIGISTSGNSCNVLRAMEVARAKKIVAVGLTGRGGKLAAAVDLCICIPSDETPRIQEAHISIGHILCELAEEELFGD
jgi:D-sedoheptulose 7-phosphate isomerase